jgi:hypothetical protein
LCKWRLLKVDGAEVENVSWRKCNDRGGEVLERPTTWGTFCKREIESYTFV